MSVVVTCKKCGSKTDILAEWHCVKCASEENCTQPSTNSTIMKLLNDVRLLLLDVDTPTREQRSDIVHRIARID